jgi:hypothetical protein
MAIEGCAETAFTALAWPVEPVCHWVSFELAVYGPAATFGPIRSLKNRVGNDLALTCVDLFDEYCANSMNCV